MKLSKFINEYDYQGMDFDGQPIKIWENPNSAIIQKELKKIEYLQDAVRGVYDRRGNIFVAEYGVNHDHDNIRHALGDHDDMHLQPFLIQKYGTVKFYVEPEPTMLARIKANNPWFQSLSESMLDSPQAISSMDTSINKNAVPALFRLVKWEPHTINLDIGGGKYDTATEYLKTVGVTNLIYDKYNRSNEYNANTIRILSKRQADTATLSNVLNVIGEQDARLTAIRNAYNHLKDGGKLYVKCYKYGKRESRTSHGFQLGWGLSEYLPEIMTVFGNARIKNQVIIAVK